MQDEQAGLWENPDEYGMMEPETFLGEGMSHPVSAKSGQRGRSKGVGQRGSQKSNSPTSQNRGAKSSMIEKEMQQLEKIKQRQQKEIETMME